MKIENYEVISSFENKNWWYRGKRDLFTVLLKSRRKRYTAILDLGCGVGSNIEVLKKYSSQVDGLDFSEKALSYCKQKGYSRLFQSDATQLDKIKDSSYDLVICSDVLEHIDDKKAIKEIYRILRPGGILLFSVPAHRYLWGPTDIMSQHLRRYEKKELEKLFQGKFIIDKLEYWDFVMYFPNLVFISLLHLFEKQSKPTNTLSLIPTFLNNLIYSLLWVENRTLMKIKNIQGVSIVGICKKK